MDGANPFIAYLATSPFGRPPCRVGQVGGGTSLTLDVAFTIRVTEPSYKMELSLASHWHL